MSISKIKVVRNDAGNCVNFLGTSNPAYWNGCLSAEVDSEDNTRVNVINSVRTIQVGETVYEYFKIPFTKFQDENGNGFATAQDAVDHIIAKCNAAGSTGTFVYGPTETIDVAYNSSGTGLLFDTGDSFVLGGVRAVANDDGKIDIRQHAGSKILYQDIVHTNVLIAGEPQTGTVVQVVDALNAFVNGEVDLFSAPDMTPVPATVNVIAGNFFTWPINLDPNDPIATEFTFDGLPATLFPSQNNRGTLQGSLTAGSYPVTIRAFNSFGFDSKTVTFVASAPTAFDNDTSTLFEAGYWSETDTADAATLDALLGGATPWSVSLYFRPSSNGNRWQNIVVFGEELDEDSRVNIAFEGRNDNLLLRIGEVADNFILMETPNNSLTPGQWHHILVTYDGAGVANGDWKVYIDGTLQTLTQDDLQGTPTLPTILQLRVGRCINNEDPLRDGLVDELAIWGSDQSASIAAIYNSGTPFDLTTLGTSPSHWWRMGDGDTFPTIADAVGSVDMTLRNATASAFVAEAP